MVYTILDLCLLKGDNSCVFVGFFMHISMSKVKGFFDVKRLFCLLVKNLCCCCCFFCF